MFLFSSEIFYLLWMMCIISIFSPLIIKKYVEM